MNRGSSMNPEANYRLVDGIEDWIISEGGSTMTNKQKGDLFCQWVLENVMELSTDEALDAQEMSGSKDHGIDAIIQTDHRIDIIQTKYGTSHTQSDLIRFHYDMSRIKNGRLIDNTTANDEAQRAIAIIREGFEKGLEIKFYYVTNSVFSDSDRQKFGELDEYKTEFEFYDIKDIETKLNEKQQELPRGVKNKWFSLPLSNRDILTFADTTAVIAVSLKNMYEFVNMGGTDLFVSNVRQYLRKTKINKEMIKTIEVNPQEFWLYNNGITIVCDDFVEESFDFRIKLQTPQIVNGCQTARSIWDVFSRKRNENDAIQGYVLVRIIKDPKGEKRGDITKYTNSQNAVRGKDFFSLENFHKKLQRNFAKLNYYYEIQRGAFTSLKPSQKAKYVGNEKFAYLTSSQSKNVIPALEATQAFASAFKGIPAIAYAGSDKLTPTGSAYDTIFDESLRPQARRFLFPYLIRLWAQNNGYGRGARGGWRAHSVLLFVHTYFLIVFEILKSRGLIDDLETDVESVDIIIWERLFLTSSLNQDLLYLTDDILERYFTDSKVDEAVGQDIRKFLRSQEKLDRHKPILMKLITNIVLNSPRNQDLVDNVAIAIAGQE